MGVILLRLSEQLAALEQVLPLDEQPSQQLLRLRHLATDAQFTRDG